MSASNSKIDAFEVNLKQIQQTNEILHSIENKLTDVFTNQTPSYKRKLDFLQYEEEFPTKSSENDIKINENNQIHDYLPTNPSFNNENQKKFFDFAGSLAEKSENIEKNRKNIDKSDMFPENYSNFHEKTEDFGYHSSIRPLEDYSANKRSLFSWDLKSKDELEGELKNLQRRLMLLEKENSIKTEEIKTSRQKIVLLENSLSIMKKNEGKIEDFPRNSKKVNKNQENLFVFDQLNNDKLNFLEQKVKELSQENHVLLQEKNKLISTNLELEKENREQQRIIRNIELSKFEYDTKISEINREHSENNKKIIEKFKSEINNLNKELENLAKEKQEFATKQKVLEKERNKLNTSYSNLLNLHNQMMQIDILKNEKNLLQNSFSEIHEKNNNNNDSTSRNSKKIAENLENYRQEIEKLKNNSVISENCYKEIASLKDEIAKQRQENDSLIQEISKLNKKNDRNDTEKLTKMEEYIKKLEIAYKNIENKYSEQLMINNELKTNWKKIEEKNQYSYEKIEQIYKKFFDQEQENSQKITIPTNSEKIIVKSCPISTKNAIVCMKKTNNSLGKTKKVASVCNIIGKKAENSKKRSSSNSNNHRKIEKTK